MVPDNFQLKNLSSINRSSVYLFSDKFTTQYIQYYGYGHFILAAYASVPALLTPDLLYKIWQNFNQYSWHGRISIIQRIAVADILISPLCTEVGHEVYEMDCAIALEFQKWLRDCEVNKFWKTCDLATAEEISQFVVDYHALPNAASTRWGKAYSENQTNEALSYVDPSSYIEKMSASLNEASQKNKENDLLQVLDKLTKAETRWHELENLVGNDERASLKGVSDNSWLKRLKSVIQERSLEGVDKISDILTKVAPPTGGLSVTLPGVSEDGRREKRRVRMLFVLTPEENESSLNTGKTLVNILQKTMTNIFADIGDVPDIAFLEGRSATKQGIFDAFTNLVNNGGIDDDLFFYIASISKTDNGHCRICCADSGEDIRSWLQDSSIAKIASSGKYNSLTLAVDASHSGTTHWLNPTDRRNVVFASSEYETVNSERLLETVLRDQNFSFTVAFVNALATRRADHLKYTNFDFFVTLITELRKLDLKVLLTPEITAPEMLAGVTTKDQLFLRGNNNVRELQTLIYRAGLIGERYLGTTLNKQESDALDEYRRLNDLQDAPIDTVVGSLASSIVKLDRPLAVLIFSDPKGKLGIESELKIIRETFLRQGFNDIPGTFRYMLQPTKKEVVDFIFSRENMNRVEMIYYAGKDHEGSWAFPDGVIDVGEVMQLVDRNVTTQLVVSNTCNSMDISKFAVKAGPGYAIGAEGKISNADGLAFAEYFFRELLIRNGEIRPVELVDEFLHQRRMTYGPKEGLRLVRDVGAKEVITLKCFSSLNAKGTSGPLPPPKDFRNIAIALNKSRRGNDEFDDQKNKWGGKSEVDGRRLTAVVKQVAEKNYEITIIAASGTSYIGEVAFYLHRTFKKEVRFSKFEISKATLVVNGYEAFTVGAYFHDGTMLELDLNQTHGFPSGFYYPRSNFINDVENIELNTPIYSKNDMQKGRWGEPRSKNKELTVSVEPTKRKKWYRVTINMIAHREPFFGDVAFFLDRSFKEPTRYVRAVDGIASLTVEAFEDFTVGAFIEDGTTLELDLSTVPGLPAGFYSIKSTQTNPIRKNKVVKSKAVNMKRKKELPRRKKK